MTVIQALLDSAMGCVTVSATDDDLVEGDHSFDLVITSADHPNVVVSDSNNTATVTIIDDDGMCTTEWHGMYYIGCTSSFKDLLRYHL